MSAGPAGTHPPRDGRPLAGEAGHHALLVIDVQRGFDDPGWGRRNNPACEENVARLVEAWRTREQPVVAVRHDSVETGSPLCPGSPGNRFKDAVPAAPDLLVVKNVNSAFYGRPDLHAWLRLHGVGRLAVCGITTNHCCETTARMAGNLGYTVDFVIDATATFDRVGPDGRLVTAEDLARATAPSAADGFRNAEGTGTADTAGPIPPAERTPVMATSVAPPAPITAPVQQRSRAPYTLVAVLGLLLVAAAPVVMVTSGLVAGMLLGEDAVFFSVMTAVPLIGAALVWRFGTWAKVVGILASIFAGGAMFWTVFGLAYPGSFADFLPGVLMPLGVVLGVGGGVASIIAKRRGRAAGGTVSTERRIATVALAIVVLAAVGSAITMALSRSAVTAEGAVAVELTDFAFDQDSYAVNAGEATTLRIHNSDAFVHTFTVPELGIDETILPGSDALVEVQPEAGEYTIYCAPHSDMSEPDPAEAGMAARLVAS